ncbi:sensor histidine kinase [Streptomyces sp. NPDC057253]|uniref:sensor histidine kinase n=1 Tax=Streptomyces sp. NPDC057253 TaxID=3346069 RepID=UPI0036264B67
MKAARPAPLTRCLALLSALVRDRSRRSSDARVRQAVAAERTRLRHDLHDGLGPLLAGVGLGLRALSDLLDDREPGVEQELLDRVRAEVSHAVTEVRRLVDALPPAAVVSYGLVEALRRHARFMPPVTVVDIVTSALPALPPTVETAVYRIVTEAMTNVVRHADARHARVTLAAGRRCLLVTVADDGRGIAHASNGVGLVSIRQRAECVGGSLAVRSAPGRGTEVRVRLPLPRA